MEAPLHSRHSHLPWPDQLGTERLTLRVLRAGDGPVLRDAVAASHEKLRPWMPWAGAVPSADEAEAWARGSWLTFLHRETLRYAIFPQGRPLMIGSLALHHFQWDLARAELGYWLRDGFEGQGFMTEAVSGVCRLAFEVLELRELHIRAEARNLPSQRVAERCGFVVREHQFPSRLERASKPAAPELVIYALSRQRWERSVSPP